MRRARVVIADRHPVVLQGLANLLGAESDFEIVASCGDAASCIEAIRTLAPDIAILDPAMPELTALKNAPLGNSENRSTHLVFFAATEDCDLVLPGSPAGHSVLLKEATGQVLVQSLRQIASGHKVVPPLSTDQAAPREHNTNSESALTVLTERERQIMRLVARGLSNKEIGRRLSIADGTIKVHLHNIFQKLEISNRTALAALAISQNEDKPSQTGVSPADGEP
ncbi:two-component system response regulator [Bradyrhizobium centrolobii]|uniref:Two-component system response regulator n=1 Tax=Bradyrhizobium centrolobii TaxID=1505087 RepID=A0A176YV86_9BRAD|nr:response regulator transcription factor [Bradyrhizobium centrolobii]OAF10689.1 two-component system response regulator [Bradyrhizobium centrolobii]